MYCSCCGKCCKELQLINLPKEYQYLDNGNGMCVYLKNNLCSIYDNRPYFCNSYKMYQLYYNQQFKSYEEFEKYLKSLCVQIQDGRINERLCKNSECY